MQNKVLENFIDRAYIQIVDCVHSSKGNDNPRLNLLTISALALKVQKMFVCNNARFTVHFSDGYTTHHNTLNIIAIPRGAYNRFVLRVYLAARSGL